MKATDPDTARNIDMRAGTRKGLLAEVAESLGVTRETVYRRWRRHDPDTVERVARALDKRERMTQRRKLRAERLIEKIENV